MPSTIDRTVSARRRLPAFALLPAMLAAVTMASVGVVSTAQPVAAFGSTVACSARTQSAVFSRWGDAATYFRIQNGGFESGTTDWLLAGGAAVVTGNESYKVGGSADAMSLRIPVGATAESRTICISRGEDKFRFFVKNPNVAGAILHVDATVKNPTNGAVSVVSNDVRSGDFGSGWAPSLQFQVSDAFGGGGTGTESVTFTFSIRGTAATWYLDDVFVDPFKSY